MMLGLALSICSLQQAASAAPFDPATLVLTGWWRASFTASPWPGTASAGPSAGPSLTEPTNPPTVGTAVNGLTPADFNGTIQRLVNAAAMTSFVSNAAGSIACLFFARTAAADAGATNNPSLIGDTDGRIVLEFSSLGVGLSSYDGATFTAVRAACGTGAYHLAQARWNSTTIEVRVDSGAWQTLARTVVIATATVRVGANFALTKFFDGRILDLLTAQSRLDDATFDNIKSYVNSRYALSL